METDRGAGQVGQHDTSPVFGGSPSINNHGDISLTAALHPEGDRMVEWGTGVFIAYSGSEGEEPPTGPESVERVEGRDRYETAAAAALQVYEAGVPAVYVASGDDYPDALTGAALAGSQDSPVLLTRSDLLPSATRAALTALAPQRIVVLGGSDSIEDDRLTELEAYTQGTVTRIGGEHRYETAALVAAELADSSTVYVATGLDYPDALAAAARAGAGDNPVLLVTKERIPAHTASALDALAPDRIVLLGDEDSVVGAVAESLAEYAPVERVAGANRYETAALLSQTLTGSVYAYVATGEDWPDALAGAAVAAHLDAPVLLTRSDLVPSATVTELERLKAPHLRVLGGETVVHPSVITELLALDYTG